MVDVNVIIENITIKIYRNMYAVNALLHKSFPNKYLSRYKSDSLDYQCQRTYGYNPVMIDPKSNGAILNLFNQNMEPHGYNLSTPLLLGSIL